MSFAQARTLVRHRLERWLFRIGPAESAPVVLGRRRIFVLPTAAGTGFAAALLVMLVAAINYNLSLGYALVFLLAGIAVVSILHAFRNLLGLSIRPARIDPVFAGSPARFRFLVTGSEDRDRWALRLVAGGAEAGFSVPAGRTAEPELLVPSRKRGWLTPGRVTLETAYPLGLIRAWSIFTPDVKCLVYPTPEAAPPPLPEGTGTSSGLRRSAAGDDDFAGLRPHRAADSPRHVAWKAFARGGPLLTKHFSGSEAGNVILDWQATPANQPREARIARLAAWILAAETSGRAFSLNTPYASIGTGSGPHHAHACLKLLALFPDAHPAN